MSKPLLSGRRLALLFLLYAKGATGRTNEPIVGITRLQKLLFLLHKEHDIVKQISQLNFEPYAYGPYSSELYDDLAFLENMGYLDGGFTSDVDVAPQNISDLSYEFLMRGVENFLPITDREELSANDAMTEFMPAGSAQLNPDRYGAKRYALSQRGLTQVHDLIESAKDDPNLSKVLAAVESVKSQFNRTPLSKLLRYVYSRYPEDATESVIANKIRR